VIGKIFGGIGIAILGVMAIGLGYAIFRKIRDDITNWLYVVSNYILDIKDKKKRIELASIRVIPPDINGRQGVVYDGKVFRNMDSGESFDMLTTKYLDPMRIQLDSIQKTLIAMRGTQIGSGESPEFLGSALEETEDVPLRDYVTLSQMMNQYDITPSYDNVILGESVKDGRYYPVTGSMATFLHGIVSGRTGFGKSVQLASIAKQLVIGGDCDVCFVDYGVNTFGMLAEYGLYPIADEPRLAIELFRQLVTEMNRRRALMAEHPKARTIQEYNRITGDNIRPLVCFVDESSSLFDKSSECRELVRELTGMGRKYQLGVFFGGTDFKVTTMPSETRGNCGLRQTFRLEEPQLSRSLIRSTQAVNLVQKGRALALIPEIPGVIEMQCPIVDRWDDLPIVGEQEEYPEIETFDEQVKAAYEDGNESISSICRVLGLHTGGDDFYKVRESMTKQDLT